MKDAEDEAFDELAKRQGMWGGGFHAKRAAAADKQKPAQSNEFQVIPGIDEAGAEHMAQPAQEPIAYVTGTYNGRFVVAPLNPAMVLPVGMAFYTTPPKREWVDLTDADADDLFVETQRHMIGHGSREFTRIFTRLINAKLKEQNNG
jgi:hypothetical protein